MHRHGAESTPRAAASSGRPSTDATTTTLDKEDDADDEQEDEDKGIQSHHAQHCWEVRPDLVQGLGDFAGERDSRCSSASTSGIVGNIVVSTASTDGVEVSRGLVRVYQRKELDIRASHGSAGVEVTEIVDSVH
jgi:hypothetical protein